VHRIHVWILEYVLSTNCPIHLHANVPLSTVESIANKTFFHQVSHLITSIYFHFSFQIPVLRCHAEIMPPVTLLTVINNFIAIALQDSVEQPAVGSSLLIFSLNYFIYKFDFVQVHPIMLVWRFRVFVKMVERKESQYDGRNMTRFFYLRCLSNFSTSFACICPAQYTGPRCSTFTASKRILSSNKTK
jgi:hypothetical protein